MRGTSSVFLESKASASRIYLSMSSTGQTPPRACRCGMRIALGQAGRRLGSRSTGIGDSPGPIAIPISIFPPPRGAARSSSTRTSGRSIALRFDEGLIPRGESDSAQSPVSTGLGRLGFAVVFSRSRSSSRCHGCRRSGQKVAEAIVDETVAALDAYSRFNWTSPLRRPNRSRRLCFLPPHLWSREIRGGVRHDRQAGW